MSSSQFAGSVSLDNITIVTSTGFAQNVTGQVAGIEIFEDIFAPFITGTVVLRDAQELVNLFPLIGEETIIINVRTPVLDAKYGYTRKFYIYKMADRVRLSERETAYVLHFMSAEGMVDANKKISKVYSGKVSDIARKIMSDNDALESKQDLNIEPTTSSTKFISNFWSPIKCLTYLTQNAVNANSSPTYVFFENKAGLNFVSLDSLYSTTPIYQEFIWDNYSAQINKQGGGSSDKDLNRDYQRVYEISTPESFNYLDRIQLGMYGSQMIHYDLTTKKYTHVGYTPIWDEDHHLNKYPLWSSQVIAKSRATLMLEQKYLNNFAGYGDVTNTKTAQRRLSMMTMAEANKIQITVPGRTDYSAGQRVTLFVPQNTQLLHQETSEDFKDNILSGVYLIAAICHKITREGHECVLELIKDSLIIDLNNAK